MKDLIKKYDNEKIRYMISGVLTLGTEYTSYFIFTRFFGITPQIAQISSIGIAAIVNFSLTNFFTFQLGRSRILDKTLRYLALLLFNSIMNNIIFNVLLSVAIPDLAAKLTATVVIFIWNFIAFKKFIFYK